jgi:glyoxylase I family protein
MCAVDENLAHRIFFKIDEEILMATVSGYHHIAIRTRDMARSMAFYREVMGCDIFRAWGEGEHRGVLLTLGEGDLLELLSGGEETSVPDQVLIHFALATDDVEGMVERAVAAGATVATAPKSLDLPAQPARFRGRNAVVKGPDGELVEFFQDQR